MRTAARLLGVSGLVALFVGACTNDYEDFSFPATGGQGAGSGTGGAVTGGGGSINVGGTSAGGTGASPSGGAAGTTSGGSGGAPTGGAAGTATGGAPTGGTGGVPSGGTGGVGGGPACKPNEKTCNGNCVGTNDPKFGCGPTACDPCQIANATAQCSSDKCTLQTCNANYGSCDSNPNNGCEQSLDTTTHCGACNRQCSTQNSTSSACLTSTCRHKCDAGFADCTHPATGPDNGCETNTDTSKGNCGTCGNNCGSLGAQGGFVCKTGACGCSEDSQCLTTGGLSNSSCNKPTGVCICDGNNCAPGEACGKQTGTTVCMCNGGNACASGESCCPGAGCADLQTNSKHCGGCNVACGNGQSCKAGVCQ